jgi:hypothetical protein
MATALFITRNDLVKNSILNGNVDTDKFIQFIKIAQQMHIQNYLGTKLYDKISDDISQERSQAIISTWLMSISNRCLYTSLWSIICRLQPTR